MKRNDSDRGAAGAFGTVWVESFLALFVTDFGSQHFLRDCLEQGRYWGPSAFVVRCAGISRPRHPTQTAFKMTNECHRSQPFHVAFLVICCTVIWVSCAGSAEIEKKMSAGSPDYGASTLEGASNNSLSPFAVLSGPSLLDGVFSLEQVEGGKQTFNEVCTECHQVEAFVGPGFMDAWKGRSVKDLFEEVRRTMPENAPGRLSRRQYTELLAYIFEQNGLPAGSTAMPTRPAELQEILIASPTK